MVLISLTAAARGALPAHATDCPAFDHADAAAAARELGAQQQTRSSSYRLDVLLRGSEIYIPARPAKPTPSPGYLALMESLRHEYEEREYAAMLSGNGPDKDTIQSSAKEISDQISVVLNIFFSSIFTGLAIWYATSNLATYRHREPLRAGASILVAIIVAIAEVVLYNSFRRKMDDAKAREQSKTEVKTVLGEPGESSPRLLQQG
ncbi:hypothetical protein TWF696_007100 [Orbilia brochopaga]|uniref:Vacuolar ATPase assembly integral membrane protein VPH2 n=1 Tax=Orbilia brochopaga TaxID=3140254 RepID=A0AAV9UTD9_9PEZI